MSDTTSINNSSQAGFTEYIVSDGAPRDHFGYSVSLYGNLAIIGAEHADNEHTDSGAAYVYRRIYEAGNERWELESRLAVDGDLDGDAGRYDWFGFSVSIHENLALIGAPSNAPDGILKAGAAYLFRRDIPQSGDPQWILVTKLTGYKETLAQFGTAVSLRGDTAVIGAPGKDGGKVFVYKNTGNGWQLKDVWQRTLGDSGFGRSVSVHDDFIAVGGDKHATIISPEGEQIPLDPGELTGDTYGKAISLVGDLALVGAPDECVDGKDNTGAAFLFERAADGTWRKTKKLVAGDRKGGEHFGDSVALGDAVLIGASHDYVNGSLSGSVYLFDLDTGRETKLLRGDREDRFGFSVALSHGRVVVGTLLGGAAYIYESGVDILWGRARDGYGSLWRTDLPAGDLDFPTGSYTVPGPMGEGWEATSFYPTGDDQGYILWARPDHNESLTAVWRTDLPENGYIQEPTISRTDLGPVDGSWKATGLHPIDESRAFILWTSPVSLTGGKAHLCRPRLPNGSNPDPFEKCTVLQNDGWEATAFYPTGIEKGLVLWSHPQDSRAMLWHTDLVEGAVVDKPTIGYTEFYLGKAGWSATGLGAFSPDSGAILWTNGDAGEGIIWVTDFPHFQTVTEPSVLITNLGPVASGWRASSVVPQRTK